MRRTTSLVITAVVGWALIGAYFVPALAALSDMATVFFDLLAAIALVLGAGSLLRSHGGKIRRQRPGWGYSVITVGAFVIMLTFGLGKVGVRRTPGYWTASALRATEGSAIGLAQLDIKDGQRRLIVVVRRAEPGARYPVLLAEDPLGEIEIDAHGHGRLEVTGADRRAAPRPNAALPTVIDRAGGGETLRIGALMSAALTPYPRMSGEYNENGGAFWMVYEYVLRPLQQTVLALLAFYVASAAFRAFRARTVESVLLLGTASIILLGQTFVGTVATGWLPDTGFWSFFQIPNLAGWIMSVLNTAGNRAIMIGIALGVAAMSLKVLLGIERSHFGSGGK
ncbi:MAG: hypothetical protein KKB50_00050 [Planctomycetes bacterium]|nr:hypothetical protein [Planctomycetota bacterium]